MIRKLLLAVLLLTFCQLASAQKVAFSTNVVDWAYLGTTNLEAGVGVSQHLSLVGGGKLNIWSFDSQKRDAVVQDKRQMGYFGVKYWPWYVYSGWWGGFKGQYEKRYSSGVWRPALEESTAVGGVLSAGYAIMLHKHFNIDFGAGIFGGRYIDYTLYRCPDCTVIRQQGPRNFLRLDDVMVTVSLIF